MAILNSDKNFLAVIIGVVSTIPSEILGLILVHLGYAKYSIFHLSSMLVTQKHPSIIMGMFVSPVFGGIVAILLYQIFLKIGSKHVIIECVGASLFMFVCLEFVFSVFYDGKIIPAGTLTADYCHLISSMIYGIIEGILFKIILFRT